MKMTPPKQNTNAQAAARAVWGYFEALRDESGKPKNQLEFKMVSKTLRACLAGLRGWAGFERNDIYRCLTVGCPPDIDFEREFGEMSFDVLVQFARLRDEFRVTVNVLRFVRRHAPNLRLDSIETLTLARAVTAECRRRYCPGAPPMVLPAENLAPPLSEEDAATVALRAARWIAARSKPLPGKQRSTIEFAVWRDARAPATETRRFLDDLRADRNLERPSGSAATPEATAAYRRNRQVALSVAVECFHREGFTLEDIVREQAERLGRQLAITTDQAFGYLLYLAKTPPAATT